MSQTIFLTFLSNLLLLSDLPFILSHSPHSRTSTLHPAPFSQFPLSPYLALTSLTRPSFSVLLLQRETSGCCESCGKSVSGNVSSVRRRNENQKSSTFRHRYEQQE